MVALPIGNRSASNAQLKRLEPVHNKGLRIALGKEKAKNHKHGNSRSGK
jgi:hypothetical protein